MQVATARRVHVLQLSRVDCSAAAAELLGSSTVIKAGIGMSYDLGQLERLFPFDAASVLDLGEAAKRLGFQQSGVRNLAGLFLRFRIPKGAQTSNWALRQLSEEQLRYAATDAWACRELYPRISAAQAQAANVAVNASLTDAVKRGKDSETKLAGKLADFRRR